MSTKDIIEIILSGGLLGTLGQGIRMVVGLKKLSNTNISNALAGADTNEFNGSRLALSLFIGFIAGALALLIKGRPDPDKFDSTLILTIIAAGYAGADFIEGVFNTFSAKFNASLPKKQEVAAVEKQPGAAEGLLQAKN